MDLSTHSSTLQPISIHLLIIHPPIHSLTPVQSFFFLNLHPSSSIQQSTNLHYHRFCPLSSCWHNLYDAHSFTHTHTLFPPTSPHPPTYCITVSVCYPVVGTTCMTPIHSPTHSFTCPSTLLPSISPHLPTLYQLTVSQYLSAIQLLAQPV